MNIKEMDLLYISKEHTIMYKLDNEIHKVAKINKSKEIIKYMEISEFKSFLESEIQMNESNEGRVTALGFAILKKK